ncbi:MAG: nicotinate phosphoribosyltransferase [Legionellales bacterium]|nr:nicotinate phosphoribosyltransferase [Legionellales bacterium]
MIIDSLLDTDLYKFTMQQVVFHQWPDVMVEYQFQLRSESVDLTPLAGAIRTAIDQLACLRLRESERAYLTQLPFMQADYLDYLMRLRLDPHQVIITTEPKFALTIRGPWLDTILFEIPCLAIMHELYARQVAPRSDFIEGRRRLQEKIAYVQQMADNEHFQFADFGTRHRFSRAWQQEVVQTLAAQLPRHVCGTSNVALAKKLRLAPMGTMAHEFIQAFQALAPTLRASQRHAWRSWLQEYPHHLGIVLSDTLNLACFLHDFEGEFARQFQGVRQDSGDPIAWGQQVLHLYRYNSIDPLDKTLVFSDSLTMEKAQRIYQQFHQQTQVMFGIGTHLTNDLGVGRFDCVIKMTECNGQPVAKISDSPGKIICKDPAYLQRLQTVVQQG